MEKRNAAVQKPRGKGWIFILKDQSSSRGTSLLPPQMTFSRNLQRKTRTFGEEPGDPRSLLPLPALSGHPFRQEWCGNDSSAQGWWACDLSPASKFSEDGHCQKVVAPPALLTLWDHSWVEGVMGVEAV